MMAIVWGTSMTDGPPKMPKIIDDGANPKYRVTTHLWMLSGTVHAPMPNKMQDYGRVEHRSKKFKTRFFEFKVKIRYRATVQLLVESCWHITHFPKTIDDLR